MLKAVSGRTRAFLSRRRGDCQGAFFAGFVFIALAPGTEDPVAFRIIGVPLLVIGLLTSVVATTAPKSKEAAQ